MRINWKKTIIILLDLMLGVYLTFAIKIGRAHV